ncbi:MULTISPECIES: DUF2799 domain-containing protein [Vibrio]|uniref:DUF2799 domain-containing protein n=1 Tax=Vibrio ostreae TaxID=2841925 RepID=A0A975YLL0_9VIBR|nr:MULTISPECIES: DUF2799 domain-containing protein [Vibrio]QXO15525.1 DUF2799 domain-containing protein [Vibrio ostreae]WGY45472.1 DUF2799 domain-containing protein [Vibrio sp. ABG19]
MKRIIVVLALTGLAACSSNSMPDSYSSSDWQKFGYEQGVSGLVKLSGKEMKQAELMTAYNKGYEQGRNVYCQQDALSLGKLHRPYHGVCDEIDPTFRTKYREGTWWDDGASLE